MRASRLLALIVAGLALGAQATPSGHKWFFRDCSASSCPGNQQCVANRCSPLVRLASSIDNSGSSTINGGVPYSTFLGRAPEAFRNWTAARVASCSTFYDVQVGANFVSPQGKAAVSAKDTTNAVIWLSGNNWTYGAATLGLTTTNYYTANSEIFDADMELNDNVLWATDGRTTAYDMESVVLHEAGHFLGLDHTPSSSIAVMFPNVSYGQEKRALAAPDIADVCSVYPGAAGALGTTCTTKANCNGALVCEGAPKGDAGTSTLTCVQDCSAPSDSCPTGYTCRASTAGFACLPQIGAPDQCKFCTNGQDCSSGLCLYDSDTNVTYCSLTCTDTTQCGAGYTCQVSPSGSFCVPNTTCNHQCTTVNDCAVDYACTGGTCLPRGNLGDRCEIIGYCKACGVCVSTGTGQAFCRTCCGSGTSTQCTGCTNTATACVSPLVCSSLVSGDSACLAGSGLPGNCASCPDGMCADGYSCVAGRCHPACSPASPGTCAVCFSLSTGGGACACPDEVAFEGEPCGIVAGALKGCGSGLACVAGPTGTTQTVCRALCDLNAPTSSCGTGFVCQLTQNIAACLPGSAGNTCASCTNAGICNAGLSCYLGRCYAACNVNVANTCATCIQTDASGAGICGCTDQISTANQPCGTQPEVHACGAALACLNGLCREQCNPQSPLNCPVNTTCTALGNLNFCQDQAGAGGGTGGSGGGTSATGGGHAAGGGAGGGGKTTVSSQGCGCSSPALSPFLLFVPVILARRRRAA